MKTKEFMKRVAKLGYNCEENEEFSAIDIREENVTVITVSTIELSILNCEYAGAISKELFELVAEYTATPTEKKGEPTYYLKSKIPKMGADRYLNWVKDEDRVAHLDKPSTPNFPSHLTKSGWEYAAGCSWEELLAMFNVEPYEEEE